MLNNKHNPRSFLGLILLILPSFIISFQKPQYFSKCFNQVMADSYPTYTRFFDEHFMTDIKILEQLYDNYIVNNFQYDSEEKIPKIIHQTWFSGEVPEEYHALQESWKKIIRIGNISYGPKKK